MTAEHIKIETPGKTFKQRSAYINASAQDLNFTVGVRVWPAEFYSSPDTYFEFVRKHEPGTPGWLDGGYSCWEIDRENSGGFAKSRAFHLDALIVHPSVTEGKNWKKKIKVDNGTKETESGESTEDQEGEEDQREGDDYRGIGGKDSELD